MNPERWKRLQAVVEFAAELQPSQRAAWLHEHCGGDDELKEQAYRLLAAYIDDDTGLERSISGSRQAAVQDSSMQELEGGNALGPHKIVRRLASGGMGSVYLAERNDDYFQERVAIMVVHASSHIRSSVRRRFLLERQVLMAIQSFPCWNA